MVSSKTESAAGDSGGEPPQKANAEADAGPAPETADIRADEEFDFEKLADYLRDKLPGADGPLDVKQFPGGHSNLTYLLRFGEDEASVNEFVLRRPPLGPIAPKAHDMGREFRVLSKAYKVFPEAPRAYHFCDDSEIIGAPFVIMERRKGIVIRGEWPPELADDPALRGAISESLIDTIARMHTVDYESAGLAEVGRPEGFLERQVNGWTERWHRSKIEDMAEMDELVGWLRDTMPESKVASLIHNDYKLDNIMLDTKGKVIGVFDWEMSTLGDPLVDFGITLCYWTMEAPPGTRSRRVTPTRMPGFMSRDELLAAYTEKTGFDTSRIDYYESFALFKTAVVLQQIYVRYHRGQTKDKRFASMGKQVAPLIWLAREVYKRGHK